MLRILNLLCCEFRVQGWRQIRDSCLAVYECWPKSLPWSGQNSEIRIHIPSSFFCLGSQRIFWQNSLWTSFWTKAEGQIRDIVSCLAVFFWVRARIIGSIHKQRHMGRQAEQPPVTSNSVCARKCADGKNCQVRLRLRTSLSCSNSTQSPQTKPSEIWYPWQGWLRVILTPMLVH
jgi:hypothetical protein